VSSVFSLRTIVCVVSFSIAAILKDFEMESAVDSAFVNMVLVDMTELPQSFYCSISYDTYPFLVHSAITITILFFVYCFVPFLSANPQHWQQDYKAYSLGLFKGKCSVFSISIL
jgi:hypothetical protein